jgi:hypothetical protein
MLHVSDNAVQSTGGVSIKVCVRSQISCTCCKYALVLTNLLSLSAQGIGTLHTYLLNPQASSPDGVCQTTTRRATRVQMLDSGESTSTQPVVYSGGWIISARLPSLDASRYLIDQQHSANVSGGTACLERYDAGSSRGLWQAEQQHHSSLMHSLDFEHHNTLLTANGMLSGRPVVIVANDQGVAATTPQQPNKASCGCGPHSAATTPLPVLNRMIVKTPHGHRSQDMLPSKKKQTASIEFVKLLQRAMRENKHIL